MMLKDKLTGIILAGGKSRRMGKDKGFIKIHDKTFVEHIIEALSPLVHEILIISEDRLYDSLKSVKRIPDEIKNAGPLAGIYTGLLHSKTNYSFVLSCDIPLINVETLKKMVSQIKPSKDVIQLSSNGQLMPLIAIYQKHCLEVCYELLTKGERKVMLLSNVLKSKIIEIPLIDAKYIVNINTPEELKNIIDEIEN